ncbi:hypothetical protein L1887_09759 [Cichorium endivia]|nr:hypothetical protein L1887_09759 [Cichorium endivia]
MALSSRSRAGMDDEGNAFEKYKPKQTSSSSICFPFHHEAVFSIISDNILKPRKSPPFHLQSEPVCQGLPIEVRLKFVYHRVTSHLFLLHFLLPSLSFSIGEGNQPTEAVHPSRPTSPLAFIFSH